MKTKKNLFRPFTAAALLTVVLASSPALHAATFTWTGAVSGSWAPASGNWDPNPAVFNNTADLSFNTLTNGAMFLAFNRTARSLSFGADIDSDVSVSFQISAGGTTGYNLTFDTDAVGGNANVSVDAGATGNITLGSAIGGTTLNPVLADNLVVDHNGTGLLLFNRPFQAAAFNITKTGTGTMQTNNNNLLTGALNINTGTLIANSFSSAGLDLANFTAINLGGGTLQIGASGNSGVANSGTAKTYATGPITVGSASTLEYKNITPTTYNAAFTGTGFALNADLAVKNVSTDTTLTNAFSINRPITGTGKITSTTYNNVAASTDAFSLGRVSLGSDNSTWNGGITIARGTFLLGGNAVNAAGTGDIAIGTTADAFGAGLTFFHAGPNGSTITYPNNIIINSGGFRAIKGGTTNHSVTFTGTVLLNGNLTLDHSWSTADRRTSLNGNISGNGGLTITRAGGSAATTARLAGVNTYLGDTTVTTGASLALASTCSLTSNVVVQSGARIGGPATIGGNLTIADTSNFYFFYSLSYIPMHVTGTVTVGNGFGIANLVGGSQGEAVPWASIPDGTYTLIGTTASTFNNITNFGAANAFDLGGGRSAYFQNGGGLQLVLTTSVSGFSAWQAANGNTTGGLDADHDNDGVNNGTEYFLGGNTSTTGFTPLPGVTANSVTWIKASTGYDGAYNTDFFVETSETLEAGSWVAAPLGAAAGEVLITGSNVKYTFPTTGPKKFARLKVTGP